MLIWLLVDLLELLNRNIECAAIVFAIMNPISSVLNYHSFNVNRMRDLSYFDDI
jgi:hypothetical protein